MDSFPRDRLSSRRLTALAAAARSCSSEPGSAANASSSAPIASRTRINRRERGRSLAGADPEHPALALLVEAAKAQAFDFAEPLTAPQVLVCDETRVVDGAD